MFLLKYYILIALVLFVLMVLGKFKKINKYARDEISAEDIEEAFLLSLAWPMIVIGLTVATILIPIVWAYDKVLNRD